MVHDSRSGYLRDMILRQSMRESFLAFRTIVSHIPSRAARSLISLHSEVLSFGMSRTEDR